MIQSQQERLIGKKIDNNKLPEILAELMDEQHLNILQLSKKTGLATTTIKRMLSSVDANPTLDSLCQLATFFDVSINQLIGLEPHKNAFSSSAIQISQLPILSWQQISTWTANSDEIHNNSLQKMVITDVAVSQSAYALIMEGTSMEPKFLDGHILICDPNVQPQNGNYVIITHSGNALPQLKQLLMDGSDWYVKSLNPAFNRTAMVYLSEDFTIWGTVVQTKMNF
jgi:SOS-response transcriptional repressor LexA